MTVGFRRPRPPKGLSNEAEVTHEHTSPPHVSRCDYSGAVPYLRCSPCRRVSRSRRHVPLTSGLARVVNRGSQPLPSTCRFVLDHYAADQRDPFGQHHRGRPVIPALPGTEEVAWGSVRSGSVPQRSTTGICGHQRSPTVQKNRRSLPLRLTQLG
jgi:hypothetical protein